MCVTCFIRDPLIMCFHYLHLKIFNVVLLPFKKSRLLFGPLTLKYCLCFYIEEIQCKFQAFATSFSLFLFLVIDVTVDIIKYIMCKFKVSLLRFKYKDSYMHESQVPVGTPFKFYISYLVIQRT